MTLLEALRAPPDAAIAIEDDRPHPWSAIRGAALRGAARIEPGSRVGLLVEPGMAWLASLLAILEAGATAVPLSPRYPDRELGALLEDAEAGALVISPGLARPGLAIPQLEVPGLFAGEPLQQQRPPAPIALLLYTSGTTARPKGAMLSPRALGHQVATLIESWQLGPHTRLVHALPLHHMHGIAIALLPCLAAGGRARMLPRFDAERVWEALAPGDTFMGVPTMYRRLLAVHAHADPPTRARLERTAAALRLCVSGSAALPATAAHAWRQLAGAIPLERYGMTEAGVICSNPLAAEGRVAGTVGFALPGTELRVEAEGRLWVRSAGLFDGYWRRPAETAAALVGGWLDTGDVAQLDADGRVRLLGRASVDILKSGGTKLSALEIEEALREHPDIAEVAVVGLPDEELGQRVVAAVVARAALDPDALRAFAAERLAAYKIPRRFVALDALPTNALGKVNKPALVEAIVARAEGT